jgi:hypothetical protein
VGYCSFPVHLEPVVNKEYGKVTSLPDGTTVIQETGSFKVAATNDATKKTVLFNASGPGTITISPDGSVTIDGTGNWLIWNPADAAASFGLPGVMLTSGRMHEELGPNMALTALSVTGRAIDVCAALA